MSSALTLFPSFCDELYFITTCKPVIPEEGIFNSSASIQVRNGIPLLENKVGFSRS